MTTVERDIPAAGVRIEDLPPRQRFSLRLRPEHRSAARLAPGIDLPDRVGSLVTADQRRALCLGPDAGMLDGPEGDRPAVPAEVRAALSRVSGLRPEADGAHWTLFAPGSFAPKVGGRAHGACPPEPRERCPEGARQVRRPAGRVRSLLDPALADWFKILVPTSVRLPADDPMRDDDCGWIWRAPCVADLRA